MLKPMLKTLVLLLVIGSFSSCEKESSLDVNQDKIYTDYEVFYNSNTDKSWVVAKFKFGGPTGTILQLDDPAFVLFENDTLPYNFFFNGHYKEYAGQITSGTFSYTDANGNIYNNTLPSYEEIQFPAGLDTISKAQAFDLKWDGTALSADQFVGLFIGSWTWGNDALVLQTNQGADNLVVGINQLANLPVGNSTCYMDRATEVDVTEGTGEGGKIRGKFRATNVPVIVAE